MRALIAGGRRFAGRNHFRHPQRQSGPRRHSGGLRRRRQADASPHGQRRGGPRRRNNDLRAERGGLWNAVAHVKPLSIGLNCSLGPDKMCPFLAELAEGERRQSPAIRTPGCPTRSRHRLRSRAAGHGPVPRRVRRAGLVNIAGGCCGNTPEHIAAIAQSARARGRPDPSPTKRQELPTRITPEIDTAPLPLRLSGSQPFTQQIGVYMMIGERTNVAGSPKFDKLIVDGDYDEAAAWPGNRSRTAPTSSTSVWTKG